MILSQDYVVQKFYQYAGFPKYKRLAQVYEASCPLCREGKSWGKKKRCYYLIKDNVICCHNCGWYSTPINWIKQVTGMTFDEINKEHKNYDILPLDVSKQNDYKPPLVTPTPTLPLDCINLFDSNQVSYYKDSSVVADALSFLEKRRILSAVNRPETVWISLNDKVHKNRIIIPFYGFNNEIIFYQSRAIYDSDIKHKPKYLGKINGERTLYNINKISPSLDYIFIFEGPIDSFFVKNGTAVAGIQENSSKSFTRLQNEQISSFRLYNKVWVLDSQWCDTASMSKTSRLIEEGQTVFIWPEKIGKKFKDINDLCIAVKKDEIDPQFFIKNSYCGLKAKLELAKISR